MCSPYVFVSKKNRKESHSDRNRCGVEKEVQNVVHMGKYILKPVASV